jgi:hypothetical protein
MYNSFVISTYVVASHDVRVFTNVAGVDVTILVTGYN